MEDTIIPTNGLKLYTFREAAHVLRMSVRTLQRIAKKGNIAVVHPEGCDSKVLLSSEELIRYIKSCTETKKNDREKTET